MANNQMFGYPYDAAGNLLSDRVANLMVWDAESRLASVGGTSYLYDAEGNRVEKQGAVVEDTVYFGGRPIARYQAGQWTDLIYGPTGLLAEVPGSQTAQPMYRLTDNLGTNVGSLLANGSFVDPIDHTPFGRVFTGNTNDPYLFTGKERDTESGLDYFGARYFASNMGRWMSPDWADKPEDVPYSDLENPQSLNLYGYVGNNPLSRADKDSHCYPVCTAIVGGLIGAGVNVGITYFTNPNATRADYAGAAASGFITGAVAGVTGGASLGAQVGVNAVANVVGGVVERSISSGHLDVGTKTDIAKDAAIGAAGPLLSAAGGKLAKAISGKDAEALGKAAEGAHLGERHAASLNKQAAAASAFDEAGRKAGDRTGKVIDGANRANDNVNKDKKDHQ